MPKFPKLGFLLLLLLGLSSTTIYAKDLTWQTGTLQQITSDSSSHMVGTMFNGRAVLKDRPVTTTHYLIRGQQYIYQVDRGTNSGEKSLELTVNGEVSFAVDGSNFYIRDEKGKQHKLQLITKALP